jgi:hypothetical protein
MVIRADGIVPRLYTDSSWTRYSGSDNGLRLAIDQLPLCAGKGTTSASSGFAQNGVLQKWGSRAEREPARTVGRW